jgi:hypothetical protein
MEPPVDDVSQAGGRGPELRDVVTERSTDPQIPMTPSIAGRDLHLPRSREMAEGVANRPPDGGGHRRIGNILNVNVYRVEGHHVPERCKSGTAQSPGIVAESGLNTRVRVNKSLTHGDLRRARPCHRHSGS